MRILQILDHVGIYLVIAGSYTPFFMVSLHHHTSASVLLIFEWIAAFLGATFAGEIDEYCCLAVD
jgi:hemolysin III